MANWLQPDDSETRAATAPPHMMRHQSFCQRLCRHHTSPTPSPSPSSAPIKSLRDVLCRQLCSSGTDWSCPGRSWCLCGRDGTPRGSSQGLQACPSGPDKYSFGFTSLRVAVQGVCVATACNPIRLWGAVCCPLPSAWPLQTTRPGTA